MSVLESKILQAAEEELFAAAQAIGILTRQRIIRGSHFSTLFQAWPEMDYLIGQIEEKQRAFFLSPSNTRHSHKHIHTYG
jgi:hypothetical protein